MRRDRLLARIHDVVRVAGENISAAAQEGKISAGLSSEGYDGGYRDALMDVELALRGVNPNRRNYWRNWNTPGKENTQ